MYLPKIINNNISRILTYSYVLLVKLKHNYQRQAREHIFNSHQYFHKNIFTKESLRLKNE